MEITQALLEDIRKVLDRQGTTDPSFDSITQLLLGAFDVHMALIYTLDLGTGMLKLRCHRGLEKSAEEKIRFLSMGKGLPGQAAATRQPVQGCHSVQPHPAFSDSELFPMGTLFVPMLTESRLTGVLGVAKGFHHEFAPDTIASLSSIARLIASYLK